jgi:hypothetical protein
MSAERASYYYLLIVTWHVLVTYEIIHLPRIFKTPFSQLDPYITLGATRSRG